MKLAEVSVEQLKQEYEKLEAEYDAFGKMNLNLNIGRGLPGKELLDLNGKMFHILDETNCYAEDGTDCRQYGVKYGLPECIHLFSELMDIPDEKIILGGESSLNLMFDQFMRIYVFGTAGQEPWSKQAYELQKQGRKLKWLCLVPGYDCHFNLTEALDFEMINVPLYDDGPDMDMIEALIKEDPTIKGIWCVPQYSNPTGAVYSDEVVKRLAKMETAAEDFVIFWDNAYIVHHFYLEGYEKNEVKNILKEAEKYGTENRILYFVSTAKITFPGSGVCAMASGARSIEEAKKCFNLQLFSHDKLNQLRHVKYLKNKENVVAHMKEIAALLLPRFRLVDRILQENRKFDDIYTWKMPEGGYFITAYSYEGCAREILEMTEAIGVTVATAASTYPYHKDPGDRVIRLAPTYPPVDELETAMKIFCVCANMAAIKKELKERKEQ